MRKNNYDEIRIENLEFFANHGVYPEETRLGQKFMISLTMYTDTRRAGRTDELESSTNYGEVSHFIVDPSDSTTLPFAENSSPAQMVVSVVSA